MKADHTSGRKRSRREAHMNDSSDDAVSEPEHKRARRSSRLAARTCEFTRACCSEIAQLKSALAAAEQAAAAAEARAQAAEASANSANSAAAALMQSLNSQRLLTAVAEADAANVKLKLGQLSALFQQATALTLSSR